MKNAEGLKVSNGFHGNVIGHRDRGSSVKLEFFDAAAEKADKNQTFCTPFSYIKPNYINCQMNLSRDKKKKIK